MYLNLKRVESFYKNENKRASLRLLLDKYPSFKGKQGISIKYHLEFCL